MIYVMMRYVNTLVSNGIIVITAFAYIYMLVFIFRTNTEQMDGKGLSSLDCNNTMEQELKAKMFQKALEPNHSVKLPICGLSSTLSAKP